MNELLDIGQGSVVLTWDPAKPNAVRVKVRDDYAQDAETDTYETTVGQLVDFLGTIVKRVGLTLSMVQAELPKGATIETVEVSLPGWRCPACQAFNGEAKEIRLTCRACGGAKSAK